MEILIEIKNKYGNDLFYPACDKANLFARIAGTKTLLVPAMNAIIELGYTIKIKEQELIL
jgi:hypothetical protein|tara:strand:- start:1010 stop:1189 length:180 start_codon:yes stop_codon:yes gene_type:complete